MQQKETITLNKATKNLAIIVVIWEL